MENTKVRKKFLTPKVYLIGACAVIVLLASSAGFFFWKYMSVKGEGGDSASKEKSQRIITQVGELYQLPTGEEPTVAQVQDKKKLLNQTFFDKAQNGDYILIYKDAKLALLYRESIDKLVNVGPVSLDTQQNGQTAGATTEKQN